MRSQLFRGEVMHRRTAPKPYRFKYGVYYCGLDLDELREVDRKIRLLSYNRRNVMSFRDGDHVGVAGEGIAAAMRRHLADAGIDPDGVRVMLLTYPRVLGYVFNPVSFYFVRRKHDNALVHIVAEVHNTHAERHVYDLAREGEGTYTSSAAKAMYVSPFIDMGARYEFACDERDGGGYDLSIEEYGEGEEAFFEARLRVSPLPLTNANVAKMLLRYPFMTLRTIGLIHWQGLKLWLRGVKFLPHSPKQEARP